MNELKVIAQDINREHGLAISSARTAIEHAHNAGKLLLEAKTSVEHGEWQAWIKNNCPFSERTAQKYMRLSKTPLTTDLGIDESLALMAKPARQTILNEMQKEIDSPNRNREGITDSFEKLAFFDLNLDEDAIVLFSDHNPIKLKYGYVAYLAKKPGHDNYVIFSILLFGKRDDECFQEYIDKGVSLSVAWDILKRHGVHTKGGYVPVPLSEINNIYDFMQIPKKDYDKPYWEQ